MQLGKWRHISGVISDKLYMTVIRPVLLYGAECWTVRKKEEQIFEKTEMSMSRRIELTPLSDKLKSVKIRKVLGVNSIQEKVIEMRVRWYGHMQRMEENNEMRVVVDMIVPGKRPRGRWADCVRRDMLALRITPEDAQGRTFWKPRIRAADPT